MEPSSSAAAASEDLIQTLISRGWCFGEVEQVKAVIIVQSALYGDTCTVDLVESELVNMDLRSLGGKSLPDPSLLRKSSYLPGPKVLQISSVRDISRSSIADNSVNSHDKGLLRLNLTDGHSEITAIEYSHIPAMANDVIPGTKVRLENKAPVRCGIVCLNPKVITVLGGIVQSLYEEWQMNQKYSGFSRESLRVSKESETGGPPPFEKLQIRALSRSVPQGRFSSYAGSTFKSSGPTVLRKDESSVSWQISRPHVFGSKASGMDNKVKSASSTEKTEEKPSGTEARPKEAVESAPVQNQAAAQKLLQKMSQPNRDYRPSRGRKFKGKGKEEETPVFTLDEWERRKPGANPVIRDEHRNARQDEYLARQLQNQFDLEDLHRTRGPDDSEAENLKMSMFSFQRDAVGARDRGGFRGRDRGRGRGWGRGRGRSG